MKFTPNCGRLFWNDQAVDGVPRGYKQSGTCNALLLASGSFRCYAAMMMESSKRAQSAVDEVPLVAQNSLAS
jgi:hypothetical protein